MAFPQCSSFLFEVYENWLMQAKNDVSKKDPSKKEMITFSFFVNQTLRGKTQFWEEYF